MHACTCMCIHIIICGVVITKVRRSVTMLNNAMGVTDDRSTKVGHYVAMGERHTTVATK